VLAEQPSGHTLQAAKTNDALSRLLENLRQEQKALAEQHYLAFRMLLTATQVSVQLPPLSPAQALYILS
jgi:hypothetical protein